MDTGLISLIALVIFSGLFSGSEIALTALTDAKVRSMEKDGHFASAPILKLRSNPQRLLISILVGNQTVNIVATVVATVWGIAAFGEQRIGLVTLIFTLILILFGSIGPKTVALRFSEPFARAMAYPLLAFVWVTRPLMWIFELFTKGLLILLRADKRGLPVASQAELEAMLDISAEEGLLKDDEEAYLKQVLRFGETKVVDIMTLLKDIEGIPIDISNEDLRHFLKKHRHSRFPVFDEGFNDIKGIVNWHDIMEHVFFKEKKFPLHQFKFRRMIVVPHTMSITELLKEFKNTQLEMSLVVDEHGQTVGVVTLEDILEEIAGTSLDPKNKRESHTIQRLGVSSWQATGETTIGEIKREIDTDLPFPEHQALSLVILEILKRFPEVGEKIKLDGLTAEIKSLDRKTIKTIILRRRHTVENKKDSNNK